MLVKILSAAALFFATAINFGDDAYAQSQTVRQSGPVTAAHVGCWTYNGILQDCGPSTIPFATSFGLWGTGTPFCILNTQITPANQHTQPYYQLCMGYATGSTAGTISLEPFNGASDIPLDIIINGVTYSIGGTNWLSAILDQQFGATPGDMLCRGSSFWVALSPGGAGQYLQTNGASGCPAWVTPGSTFNNPLRSISSGATDTASSTDGTVAWNSSAASSKVQNIYACGSGVSGRVLIIKDEKGNAATYPITITPASGTIDNAANYVIYFNLQSVTLQCDGTSSGTNWIVL